MLALYLVLLFAQLYYIGKCVYVKYKTNVTPWQSIIYLGFAALSSAVVIFSKAMKFSEHLQSMRENHLMICNWLCMDFRVYNSTSLLFAQFIFSFNQWNFSLRLREKMYGDTDCRASFAFKVLISILCIVSILTELFIGLTEESTTFKSEYMCAGITAFLMIGLLDALVRIRRTLGKFDRNFSVMVLQVLAFLIAILSEYMVAHTGYKISLYIIAFYVA